LPSTVALQETVAVPDPVTLLGVIVPQVKPDGTVSVRATDPAKWFAADTLTVEIDELPAFAGDGEVAAIAKSRNWKVAVAL
jgi:hypothetical protein